MCSVHSHGMAGNVREHLEWPEKVVMAEKLQQILLPYQCCEYYLSEFLHFFTKSTQCLCNDE